MHKKDFIYPKKTNLRKGAILPIYTGYKDQTKFAGNAKLIERLESPTYTSRYPLNQRAYIRAEVGDGNVYNPQAVIWSWEYWKIQFIDGPDKGWTTARKIAYFVKVSFNHDSGYEHDNLL